MAPADCAGRYGGRQTPPSALTTLAEVPPPSPPSQALGWSLLSDSIDSKPEAGCILEATKRILNLDNMLSFQEKP